MKWLTAKCQYEMSYVKMPIWNDLRQKCQNEVTLKNAKNELTLDKMPRRKDNTKYQ